MNTVPSLDVLVRRQLSKFLLLQYQCNAHECHSVARGMKALCKYMTAFYDDDDMQAGSGREHGGDTEEEAGGGEAEGGGGGGGGGARQGERGAGQEEDHGGTGDTDADENT